MALAIWHLKLDVESNKKKERIVGVVITNGPTITPDINQLISGNQKLIAIQSMNLLVEYNQSDCSFASIQVK